MHAFLRSLCYEHVLGTGTEFLPPTPSPHTHNINNNEQKKKWKEEPRCLDGFLLLVFGWSPLTIMCGGHWWATQAAKHVSDLGNQHSNGPHQDQISDNPSA